MSLFFKPHTILVETASEASSGGISNNLVFAPQIEVQGQITAKDISAAYESFGIDNKQPHKFMFDIEDATYLPIGSRCFWDNRIFAVTTPVRINYHDLITDHAAVMLEELDV